ncbi:MAG: SusC/RagA family TonB-linked outer membrane protein [Candidatus Cryptobacteroides sp.]
MKKFLFFAAAYLVFPLAAMSQTLTGTIVDSSGEPVPGAAAVITGTTDGAVADADGKFVLQARTALPEKATLTFSSLGYEDVVLPIAGRTEFHVVLKEAFNEMEESVVIGYATVKKKDLTGALSSVSGDRITSRQTQTVSQALQGAMPGVTVTRSSSTPGGEASIRIRGITSMTDGATDPYILIDGVKGSLSDVNPNDIANITVLKDAASASIYGSQAAAGVILVTTKRAIPGATSISYTYSLGVDTPTKMPEYMDAVSYMEAVNELKYNDLPSGGWYQQYDGDLVSNYWKLNASDPDTYPNTDWMDMVLKDRAIRHSHTLSLHTSGKKLRSAVSLGYDNVDGLYVANQNWKRYTARFNNDLQIYDWLKLSTDISFKYVDRLSPHADPSTYMRYMPAIYAAVWSNGLYAPGRDANNIYAGLMSAGETTSKTYTSAGKLQIDIEPAKGLTFTALFSPKFYFSGVSDFQRQTAYYNQGETTSSKYISQGLTTTLEERRGRSFEQTSQIYANWQATFAQKHNLTLMAGYENYYYNTDTIIAANSDFPNDLIEDLKAGSADAATATSSAVYELARNSFFGRVMYNYASRYYVQGNVRRDGTSRFAPSSRWGTFLSASAGWVFTEEAFMKSVKDVLNHGKIRVSYGELGNERIKGYYPYQSTLSVNHPVAYAGQEVKPVTGYAQSEAVVTDLTWETTSTIDVGLDLSMLRNRLSLTADWYYKNTTGMLIQVPVAPVIGLSDPFDNLGDMHTKGWEVSLGWNDTVGDFSYKVNFNLSDDVSIMGDIAGKEVISSGKIIKKGYEYQSWYGYKTDGLFQTQQEVDASPTLGTQYPGDVKYRNLADADGSAEIINAEYDRAVLCSSLPHFNFGGSIDLYWKGIDLNVTFQGVGKRNAYLSNYMVQPLRGQVYNFPKYLSGGASWSYKNTVEQNRTAKYPRYSWVSGGSTSTVGNYAYSDYWIINGSYFRVKNITLGYTLPSRWTDKIRMKSLRISASLSDFFTFSHFPEGWDPEVGATTYPITKSAVFSVSVKF